jgi:hypothetical protein
MTREQAVKLIADALEGRAQEAGLIPGQADRGRGSYVRQADYLLAHAEAQETIGTFKETDWYQEQARLAKDDSTKKWWTVRDMGRALDLAPATAACHVNDAVAKNHVIGKTGPKIGKGSANHYRWNESDTNPLWVAQTKPADLPMATSEPRG